MFNEDPFSSIKSRALKGEKRPTYWCISAILNSLFFPLPFLVLSPVLWFTPRDYYCLDHDPPPLVHGNGPFYSAYCDWFLLF